MLGAARDGAAAIRGRRREGVTVRLDGIDLVVFDKDGTIIEFGAMWSGWAVALADGLRAATGRSVEVAAVRDAGLRRRDGSASCPAAGSPRRRWLGCASGPRDVLVEEGVSGAEADRALAAAWHAPDPVGLARPLTDLAALFGRLRACGPSGRQSRRATTATRPSGPSPHSVSRTPSTRSSAPTTASRSSPRRTWSCGCAPSSASSPARTAVVGDSPADLRMGRAAGAGLVVGVLTGVGARSDLEPQADAVIGSVEGAPDLAAAADQAEHEQEQVDEVEVELERADDGRLLHRAETRREVARLDALDVVGGQRREQARPRRSR